MVKDHLSDLGFEVHTFDRALGTTNEIKRVKADLLILDIDMPALRGDKICEILRKQGYFPKLKILLYSVLEDKELAKIASEQGADDYLHKSQDLRPLAIKVKKLLEAS